MSVKRTLVGFSLAALFASASASAAVALKGTWVAKSPNGKVVLHLRGSGKNYRGTYTTAGKTSKVTVQLSNADGAGQVRLTFTATHLTSLCGLVSGRLMCSADTGTLVFVHS